MTKEKYTMTMLTISTGFLVVSVVFRWNAAIYISLGIGIIGIVSPSISRQVSWLWDKIGFILGLIIPKVVLIIIFYLFLFPVSLLSKLFRKDPLSLSKEYKSLFSDRKIQMSKDDFEKTW